MIPKDVEDISEKPLEHADNSQRPSSILPIIVCTCAFILSALISVVPLSRMSPIAVHIPLSTRLTWLGGWWPIDLGLSNNLLTSRLVTLRSEVLLCTALAFTAYTLCALLIWVWHQPGQRHHRRTLLLIWLGTVVVGCIFLFTPSMPSHDIFSYASYGRLMVVYHANPYFIPPSTYPHDPVFLYNDWSHTIAVYGPLSLTAFSLLAQVTGTNIPLIILAFRLFTLSAHLLNTLLVTTILRTKGCSPRTVALGTLLYAWNPLVLLEGCLSGHIDVFMMTFLLLGILLYVRREQQRPLRPRDYLPPLILFTLATLVRLLVAPLIMLFIITLARNALPPAPSTGQQMGTRHWRSALLTTLLACSISGLVALVGYAPLWFGHSVSDILHSFALQPATSYAENSFLRTILEWNKTHHLPVHTFSHFLIYQLSLHSTWNLINFVVVLATFAAATFWVWRVPTMNTITLTTIAVLGALLIVTPWFYPWYVIWLVGLAAVCLPIRHDRLGRSLVAFSLAFSASGLISYYIPLFDWLHLSSFEPLTTFALPLLAFFIFLLHWPSGASSAPSVPTRSFVAASLCHAKPRRGSSRFSSR
jgi:hypothetical protein